MFKDALIAMDDPETFVPHHMRSGYMLYIEHGISPGSFGDACIRGDIEAATRRADHINVNHIESQIEWCKRYANASVLR